MAAAEGCTDCVAGKYASAERSTGCVDCAAGKYGTTTGADDPAECVACSPGKYSPARGAQDEAVCQDCVAGKYVETQGNVAADDCVSCGAGKYSSAGSDGPDDCLDCERGSSSPAGAGVCSPCAAGKFSFSLGASSCSYCPAGKISSERAQDCTFCEAGTYSAAAGQSSCVGCVSGKYSTTVGATDADACMACNGNALSAAGSSNITDCKCKQDFSGPDGGPCVACEAGKVNPEGGPADCQVPAILPQPVVNPGGGDFTGYVDVQIRAADGDLFFTSGLAWHGASCLFIRYSHASLLAPPHGMHALVDICSSRLPRRRHGGWRLEGLPLYWHALAMRITCSSGS